MPDRILVINPNSTGAVSGAIADAIEPTQAAVATAIGRTRLVWLG